MSHRFQRRTMSLRKRASDASYTCLWAAWFLLCSSAPAALAQGPITFQYFYDDLNQLLKVVDSTGVVIDYTYDPVGNILQIGRSTITPGAVTIFSFTPQQGGPFTTITIQGQGFSTTPSLNIVKFNGIAAPVVSATATSLVVQVPIGALTGSISVTVGVNTATSTRTFTALPIPVITSISPNITVAGASIANFQVTGANLTASTFSFVPTSSPPAITIGSVSINPTGTSATLSLAISSTTVRQFVLVATNSFGASSEFPSTSNTLTVGTTMQSVSSTFSILNTTSPAPTSPLSREADGLTLSILNTLSPLPTTPMTREANAPIISILNGISPAPMIPTLQEADGLMFSALNSPTSMSVITSRVKAALTARFGMQSDIGGGPLLDFSLYGPDTDGDGIPDALELLIGTDPHNPDTDGDGFPDGLEIALGSDPLDPLSKPSLLSPGNLALPAVSIRNQAGTSGQPTKPK